MASSTTGADADGPTEPGDDGRLAAQVLALVERLRSTDAADEVLDLFEASVHLLGATSATFLSFIRDDALLASYRSVHVGHPTWPAEYARQEWFTEDPWLAYALHESEPVLARDIEPSSPRQQAFTAQAIRLGYASALIVPAPSPQGQARIGVLCLGHDDANAFEHGLGTRLLLARSLAMEMHAWMRRSVRDELIRRSGVNAGDIELLRHELAGRGSKAIGSLTNLEGKTIDSRFQRVCAKLGVPNRRAAVRVALLYGLL
jgi:hypothetical protein